MNSIIIRRCTRDDLAEVISINERTLPENYPESFYESILKYFPESFLVAEAGGTGSGSAEREIVGYVMFRVEPNIDRKSKYVKKGHLVSIAVLKKYQGHKIGYNLLVEAMKRVKDYRVDCFVLEVRVTNQIAINLYKKLGFEIEKVINNYYRDGEDAYYMSLNVKDFTLG